MKLYLITCDPRQRQEHELLEQRIRELGGLRFQLSAWLLWSPLAVGDVRSDLAAYIDSDDRIFVGQLTGATAWRHAAIGDEQLRRFIMRSG